MKIVRKEERGKRLRLLLHTADDLWHLSHIVLPGDKVWALTKRREEVSGDRLRSERGKMITVRLGVVVENVEFHEFSDRLRVGGPIFEGPEWLEGIGGYHTFNIEPGVEVAVEKEEWSHADIARIQEAVKSTETAEIVFVALEEGEATIAALRQWGLQPLATVTHPISGKGVDGGRAREADEREFFGQTAAALRPVASVTMVVILGPGFTREHFLDFLKEREPAIAQRCHSEPTSYGGIVGIRECLRRGSAVKAVKEHRVARETEAVEAVMLEISMGGKVAYGQAEVAGALDAGAVATLLVTDNMMHTAEGRLLMERTESAGAKVLVVSTLHDGGKVLAGLGGVAALLRYRWRAVNAERGARSAE